MCNVIRSAIATEQECRYVRELSVISRRDVVFEEVEKGQSHQKEGCAPDRVAMKSKGRGCADAEREDEAEEEGAEGDARKRLFLVREEEGGPQIAPAGYRGRISPGG